MKVNPQQGHVLFISERLVMGGIATLIVNFGKRLIQDGWKVSLIAHTIEPEARKNLPPGIRTCELAARFKRMYFPSYARRLALDLGLSDLSLVFATDTVASWLGTILSTVLPSCPAVLCGVYTQKEFCYPPNRTFLGFGDWLRCRNFDKHVPDTAKLFQSELVRDLHAESFGRSLDDVSVCVLPVDGDRFARCRRQPERRRFVSLGRLSYLKTYNLYMIDVVRILRDRGHSVCWDVYGAGELEAEMLRRIRSAGLDDCIRLHGFLAEDEVPRVMERAGAFIGQGTALFEAGFCRVPSIVGVLANKSEATYGYLHELPYGVCGEQMPVSPTQSTTELLERLLVLSEDDYEIESERTWRYVQRYELSGVYRQLLTCFEGAQRCKRPYSQFVAYNLHGLYRKAVPRRRCESTCESSTSYESTFF